MSALLAAALLLRSLLAPADAPASASSMSMQKIPGAQLSLGTNLDGIVQATDACSSQSLEPCRVEQFADELGADISVEIASFYIDRREVSQAEYARCVSAGRCAAPRYAFTSAMLRRDDYPIVLVTQSEAASYCEFVHKRLPSEAEWELAAGGEEKRDYPWGRLFHAGRANAGQSREPYTSTHDGYELLAPVGAFHAGRSPLGVMQLAGNVSEWTSTLFAGHSPEAAPPQEGRYVVKGGSFIDPPVRQRVTGRRMRAGSEPAVTIGFRCARSIMPQD